MIDLFVYGTLQDHMVQQSLIGRTIDGAKDTLEDYTINTVLMPPYSVAVPKDGGRIDGRVLIITQDELTTLDAYEGECYLRIRVWLVSGREAWVYIVNPACYPDEDFAISQMD